MRGDFDEDEYDEEVGSYWDDADDDGYCQRCDCRGYIIVCVDDMCRGCGECMHGDGTMVCPDCKGQSGDGF